MKGTKFVYTIDTGNSLWQYILYNIALLHPCNQSGIVGDLLNNVIKEDRDSTVTQWRMKQLRKIKPTDPPAYMFANPVSPFTTPYLLPMNETTAPNDSSESSWTFFVREDNTINTVTIVNEKDGELTKHRVLVFVKGSDYNAGYQFEQQRYGHQYGAIECSFFGESRYLFQGLLLQMLQPRYAVIQFENKYTGEMYSTVWKRDERMIRNTEYVDKFVKTLPDPYNNCTLEVAVMCIESMIGEVHSIMYPYVKSWEVHTDVPAFIHFDTIVKRVPIIEYELQNCRSVVLYVRKNLRNKEPMTTGVLEKIIKSKFWYPASIISSNNNYFAYAYWVSEDAYTDPTFDHKLVDVSLTGDVMKIIPNGKTIETLIHQ